LLVRLVAEEIEVEEPIGVGMEYGLAVVAALGDVVRYVDRHDPRLAGHFLDGTGVRLACIGVSVKCCVEYG